MLPTSNIIIRPFIAHVRVRPAPTLLLLVNGLETAAWDGRLWRNVRAILAAIGEVVQKLKWGAHMAQHKWHADFICLFLGAFAQLRKATIALSRLSVRPPARMEELGPPLDGFS